MSDRVAIEIHTVQRQQGTEERQSIFCNGRIRIFGEEAVLRYADDTENGTVHTRLTLGPSGCRLENTGALRRVMEFVPGETTTAAMEFPFGRLEFEVVTRSFDRRWDKKTVSQMDATLSYDLYQAGELFSCCELEIEIRPRK